MTILIIILRAAALICLGSLLICGLFIGANKNNKEKMPDFESSARFHRTLGIITTVLSAAAILV
jgi:NADH:ubiquinone oxidoreductase subunit 3 (subunit A)